MKYPSLDYDNAVAQKQAELRGHKHTQLTESECAAEIAQIQDGAKSSFEREMLNQQIDNIACAVSPVIQTKKRRGRPPGSRNRPKI